jgi:hypothetical protein
MGKSSCLWIKIVYIDIEILKNMKGKLVIG